jgi:uncharacterized protein (TIGR02246 family)
MRLSTFAAAIVLAGASFALTACGGDTGAGDEAAIREVQKKWLEAIVAKDASAIAGLYAEDAQMFPPNVPKAVGRDAIQKGWEGFLGLPGMTLTFETEKFNFAKSNDLAVAIETYKFSFGEGAAMSTETGKSVVTWAKRDGKWYVLTDMFSSDTPPAPPPATPAAPAETPAVDPTATTPAVPGTPAPATPASPAPATPPSP